MSSDVAAIMMCSTATAYHALRLASLQRGQSVEVLGFGGLGVSAVQLARALGASEVYALDVVSEKLQLAAQFGTTPSTPARRRCTRPSSAPRTAAAWTWRWNSPATPRWRGGLRSLTPGGKLMIVAINLRSSEFNPFADLQVREHHIIGCSDHTRAELVELLDLAARGAVDLSRVIRGRCSSRRRR